MYGMSMGEVGDGRGKNTLKGGTKRNSKAPVTDNLSEWLIGNKPFLWVLRGTSWKDTRVWKASSLRTTRPHGRVFKEIILSLHPPPNPPQQRHASSRTDISLLSLRMSEDSSTELAPVSISKMSAGLESDTLWAHRWLGQTEKLETNSGTYNRSVFNKGGKTIQWRKDSLFDNSMEGPQKTKNRTTIWSSNFTPEYISRKRTKTLIQTNVPQCSLQHYLQQPTHGGNPSAHQQTTGQRRCSLCMSKHTHTHKMECSSTIKRMKFCHFQKHRWT